MLLYFILCRDIHLSAVWFTSVEKMQFITIDFSCIVILTFMVHELYTVLNPHIPVLTVALSIPIN